MRRTTVLAVVLSWMIPISVRAAPADHEQMIEAAAAHAANAEYFEALGAYEDAYRALPAEERGSTLGRFIVLDAAQAAQNDYRRRNDEGALRRAQGLLQAFSQVAQVPLGEVHVSLSKIEELLAANAPQPVVPQGMAFDNEHAPGLVSTPKPMPEDMTIRPRRARSAAGLALLTTGGIAILSGIGTIYAGSQQEPWMEQKLAQRGWLREHPQHFSGYNGFILDARRMRNIDYGVGAGLVIVGSAAVMAGVLVVLRHRRRMRRDP